MLKEKDSRIEQIQAEIRDASVKVREITVKAIEGAAGASALTRVSEIAMQQALIVVFSGLFALVR